jgi:hypothetical protein
LYSSRNHPLEDLEKKYGNGIIKLIERGDFMKKQTKYSSDFKLQVVKEYLTSDLSLADIASKFDIPSVNTVHRWVKLYTDSGYNDDVFNSKKGRPKSIISDISKVPPFIYESAGITKDS